MKRRRLAIPILLFLVLAVAGCNLQDSGVSAQDTLDMPVALDLEQIVSATGEVRPARWAGLSFPVGGMVRAVHVIEGQDVEEGQLLAELDAIQLARAVAEAHAALSAAQARLAQVQAGPHPYDVISAEQAVLAAGANAAVAETQVEAAEAQLGQTQSAVSIAEAQVAVAQAGVTVAQAELTRARAGAGVEKIAAAEASLDKARAAVRTAQARYDWSGRKADTAEALALEQATLDLEIAQADYERVVSGPRGTDLGPLQANITVARSQVALARAQLEQAKSQLPQAESAVAQAEAGVLAARSQTAQAQANLDRLRAGPTAEETAVAAAAVAQARETLATAQATHNQTRLLSPMAGTIGLVQVRPGEEVMVGQTVFMVGDLTTLRVETTDLDEYDVARLRPGQGVDLTFDALPEKVLRGRVVRIAPMSTPDQAAVTYPVIIEFVETDPALRWGMTAFVDIRAEE